MTSTNRADDLRAHIAKCQALLESGVYGDYAHDIIKTINACKAELAELEGAAA